MPDRVVNRRNLHAGPFFVGIAGLGMWGASRYPLGTLVEMGPGFFPFALSVLLLLVGLLITAGALIERSPGGTVPLSLRPTLAVLGSVILFGLLIDRLGFFLTAVLTICVGCLGMPGLKFREAALVALAMATGCVFLFVKVLALPVPVWPSF